MNFDEITVFVKVAQCGSFTHAAKYLGMPISTVSAKVSSLEKRLGITLFQRTTRKLQITEAGKLYFESCSNALQCIQATEEEILIDPNNPQGKLKITAPEDIGNNILSHIIRNFLDRYKRMEIEIFMTNRIVDLTSEGIDLAIRAGNLKDSTLIAKKFVTEKLSLWASSNYLKENGIPTHPNQLNQHEFLRYSFDKDEKIKLSNGKEETLFTVKCRVQLDSAETAKTLTLLGQGIGLLHGFQCNEEEKQGKLIRILPDWYWHDLTYYFVYPNQRFLSPKVRTFISFAEQYMQQH